MNFAVAVRELCEFTARAGDLDLRFTPAPSALEGMAGHATVRTRRTAAYETEVAVSGVFQDLLVRGRADGYDPVANQLEEIKTYRGKLDAVRENQRLLHRAQARVYAHLLCQARGLSRLRVAVVYFNIGSGDETVLTEDCSAGELEQFFNEQCGKFLAWARAEAVHRQARNEALARLSFPHGEFRAGQRDLAVAVYRAARDGSCLMAQAPTGIGKTLGTIFPVLKASPGAGLDRVFFLTAKGTGHALAIDALDTVNAQLQREWREGQVVQLRVLDLQAREKTCVHPDKACHPDSCPLAKGFYDRLPDARAFALEKHARLDAPVLRDAALAHDVCPYYLSQELVRWSDVVIGDYNYFYDVSAMLHALTQANQWKVAVLVDEAHNLLERARRMYSGELSQAALAAARRDVPAGVKKPLDALQRAWNAFNTTQEEAYRSYDDVPPNLLAAVRRAVSAMSETVADMPLPGDHPLLGFYFEALQFIALAEQFGDHALFDVTQEATWPGGHRRGAGKLRSTLCVRNVIPAPYLSQRYAAAHATVLFSGTFSPRQFYCDTLGLPGDTAWIDVAGPFRPEQLSVRIASHISTRYRDREQSLGPIAEQVAGQYRQQPGNYLCFFSSFEYLGQVAALMAERYPQVPVWLQTKGMDEAGRTAFLERFSATGQGVGFAVLGGAFSEGVDLPGDRLVGAFIATLGLPQVNPVNENIRRHMALRFGEASGHEYTYLYPGLQKVVQAAGRVIRTENDQGTVVLMDDRYRQARVRALLPVWWQLAQ